MTKIKYMSSTYVRVLFLSSNGKKLFQKIKYGV